MLDIFKTETRHEIVPMKTDDQQVAFLCNRCFPLDEAMPVQDTQGRQATVVARAVRQLSEDVWLHFGWVEEGSFVTAISWPQKLRSDPRLKTGLRVRSGQLPGLSALTTDVSLGGIQLETKQSLNVGERIEFTLDLDDESLELTGVVRWSQLSPDYRAGIQLVDLTNLQARRLSVFLHQRAASDDVLPSGTHSDHSAEQGTGVERSFPIELLDAHHLDHSLRLKGRTPEGQVVEYEFLSPSVNTSNLTLGCVLQRLEREPVGPGRELLRFYGGASELLLELETAPPKITARERCA